MKRPGQDELYKIAKPTFTVIGFGMKVACLLAVPALIAWTTGRPFIFPSLGPSAFALAMDREEKINAFHVLGGHLIGVLCGFLAFHLIASGFTVSHLPSPFSPSLLRLAVSGVFSVAMTSIGMLAAKVPHEPACATTMIVSLGLLPTFSDAVFIMLAVTVMYAVHRLISLLSAFKK